MKFEAGKTYWTRSVCDHNCIFSFTVVSRTAKTVMIQDKPSSTPRRRGVTEWNGVECFAPFGRYSMAAIISADRVR